VLSVLRGPATPVNAGTAELDRHLGPSSPNRSQVVLFLERAEPSPEALETAVRLGRRLSADVLVAMTVERDVRWDELDLLHVRVAEHGVQAVVDQLVAEGVIADGTVIVTRVGAAARAALDLTEELDPDLVAVLARRGSRLRVLPGSRIAHAMQRRSQRPVLVISDRAPVKHLPWRRPRRARLEVVATADASSAAR
jgi:nucleotide-binding universal stress UspA family protein